MRGINKAIIIGHVGADPEIKFMPSGKAVANFSVATSDAWKDKQSGENQEATEWHRVVAFGRLAEIVGEYVAKGSMIYIEGKIQTRSWDDQGGQKRYMTEIIASQMQMLGGKAIASGQAAQERVREENAQLPERDARFEGFDDDIPFY